MSSTMFAVIFLAIIAFLIYALREVFYEGALWGLLSPVLIIGGLVIEYFYQSVLGTIVSLFGIVLLISAYINVIKKKKEAEQQLIRKYTSTKSNRYSSMPSDAHAQVEALARFIFVVYKNAPYAKNNFAKGNLYLYRNSNGICTLDFWYDWDYSPAESIVREHYALDSSITFDGSDMLRYQTNNVDHFDWIIHPVTKRFYLDPVIATLQNECPGLQITQREILQSGIHVAFQVR